jgi:hypothetical protein
VGFTVSSPTSVPYFPIKRKIINTKYKSLLLAKFRLNETKIVYLQLQFSLSGRRKHRDFQNSFKSKEKGNVELRTW